MKEKYTEGIDLAEEFVTSIEDTHLDELRDHMNQSEHASKICGCRTCKHVEKFAKQRFEDEIIRIYGEDEEEYIGVTEPKKEDWSDVDPSDWEHHFGG